MEVPTNTKLYVHPVQLVDGEFRAAENSGPRNSIVPQPKDPVNRPGGGIEFRTNVPKKTLPAYSADQ